MWADLIPELGLFCLILSLGFAVLLTLLPVFHRLASSTYSLEWGRSFALGQMALVTLSFMALAWAFYSDDFSVMYVAHNSNAKLPLLYKLGAIWGGHEGSMLLWYAILCLWTCLFALALKKAIYEKESIVKIQAFSLMVLGLLSLSFNLFILMTSNPFARYLPEIPIEGADLNPLLQDFGLLIHPPILYLGYVGFAIPFALTIGCLLTAASPNLFSKLMKPWVLAPWAFLTLGIALGSWWAYYELGWGGWWFWDPVENASFMPWLAGIALLHMVKVTSKTQTLTRWTALLALICFSFSLLGTFLVRSGLLTSVHAFATDPLRGRFILNVLALSLGGGGLIYALRAKILYSAKATFFSREGFIFIGSVLLVVLTLSILLGTLYPTMSDLLLDTKLSVGPPYFNTIFIPFVSFIALLMGIAPHIKWLRDDPKAYPKWILIWGILSLGPSLIIALIFNLPLNTYLILGLFLSFWILVTSFQLLFKRFRSKNLNNQSFISMFIAHLGVALCIAGVTLTTELDIEKDLLMKAGDKVEIGNYQFHLKALKNVLGPNYEGVQGVVEISILENKDKVFKTLYPEKRFYIPREMPVSETAIDPGFFRDLYVALGDPLNKERWSVRIYIKPFVRWIWFGAIFMATGAFCALIRWPKK